MTIYTQICGSPKTAVAALDADGKIHMLTAVDTLNPWNMATPDAPASNLKIMRSNGQSSAVALTSDIQYLTCLGNGKAKWKSFGPGFKSGFTLGGIAGDTDGGFMVIDSAMSAVYHLGEGDQPEWKLSTPLPFAKAAYLAGDLKNGVLVVNDADRSRVARSGTDCCSWVQLPQAPINIDQITVDAGGIVAYGEGQIYSLAAGKDAVWKSQPAPNFGIAALSGGLADGVLALVGDGSVIAWCKDVSKPCWIVLRGPDVPAAPVKPAAVKPVKEAAVMA